MRSHRANLAARQRQPERTLTPSELLQARGDLAGWRLFTHLVGPTGLRNLDHVPVMGAYPVSRWRPGETIRDRFVLQVGAGFAPGTYTWYLGFWNGGDGAGRRLPVTPVGHQDGEDRMVAFTFTVE
jgi:hypothetical protein